MGGRGRGAQGGAAMSRVTRRPFCFDRNNRTPVVFGYLMRLNIAAQLGRANLPRAGVYLARGFFGVSSFR
jgi:hypothetical protein